MCAGLKPGSAIPSGAAVDGALRALERMQSLQLQPAHECDVTRALVEQQLQLLIAIDGIARAGKQPREGDLWLSKLQADTRVALARLRAAPNCDQQVQAIDAILRGSGM